ncbi:hypothetical protein B0H14DRAFT_2940850, partial [Mycena olivaceomarginata]
MFCIVPSHSSLHTFPLSKASVTFIPFLPSLFALTLPHLLPSYHSLFPLSPARDAILLHSKNDRIISEGLADASFSRMPTGGRDGLRMGWVIGACTRDSTSNTAHRTVATLVACGLRESRTSGPGQTCRVVPHVRSVRVDVARARRRTWYGPCQGQGMQHLLCSGSKYCDWKGARGRSSPKSSSTLLAAHSPARAAPFRLTQAGLGWTVRRRKREERCGEGVHL